MTEALCGAPHPKHPSKTCGKPAGHLIRTGTQAFASKVANLHMSYSAEGGVEFLWKEN